MLAARVEQKNGHHMRRRRDGRYSVGVIQNPGVQTLVWKVYFRDDADKQDRWKECATREDALQAACGLLEVRVDVYILGPNKERIEPQEIRDWRARQRSK